MSPLMNRRGFLGKGAVLALGALAVTPNALHAASSPLPREASTTDAAALAARIAALLDSPIPDYFTQAPPCTCRGCEAIRQRGLSCAACGFQGTPIVEPCECRASRADHLAFLPPLIAELEAGIERPNGYSVRCLPLMRAELAEVQARPDRMCRASAKDSTRKRQHPHCAHGMTWCPTCANMDGDGPLADAGSLLVRLREVRALLHTTAALA